MFAGGGRRRFLREVIVVMLGVLVALGLEQAVSGWREAQRTEAMMRTLHEEIVGLSQVLSIRLLADDCIVAKLDTVEQALTHASFGLSGTMGRPPYYFSSRGSWNGSTTELVARHRGAVEARAFGMFYQGMDDFSRVALREQEYWAPLQALEGHTGPLAPAQRWHLREALAGARYHHRLLTAIATQMLSHTDGLGIERDTGTAPIDITRHPICAPLQVGSEA